MRIVLLLLLCCLFLVAQPRTLKFSPPDGAEQRIEDTGQQVWLSVSGERQNVEVVEKRRLRFTRDNEGYVMETTAIESSLFANGRPRRDPLMEARLGIPMRLRCNADGRPLAALDFEETSARILERVPPQFQAMYRTRMTEADAINGALAAWEAEVGALLGRDLRPGESWPNRLRVNEIPTPDPLYVLNKVMGEADCAPAAGCLRIRTVMSSDEEDLEALITMAVPAGTMGEFGTMRGAPQKRPLVRTISERVVDLATGLLYELAVYRLVAFDANSLPPGQPVVAMEQLRLSKRQPAGAVTEPPPAP